MICVSFTLPDGLKAPTAEEIAIQVAAQATIPAEEEEEGDEDVEMDGKTESSESKKRSISQITDQVDASEASNPKRRKMADEEGQS